MTPTPDRPLRRGYTTGTCAAAASRAAAEWLLQESFPAEVTLRLPGGDAARLTPHPVRRTDGAAEAFVIKDAGDDPDITHGAEIHATVTLGETPGVCFRAGEGVGTVTREGLRIPKGEAAINPVPRQMISEALAALTPPGAGWQVTVAVPGGKTMAAQTHNPRLGILGGISILGTSGYVLPRSHRALRNSLPPFLAVAQAEGLAEIILVPGNVGRRAAARQFPEAPEAEIVEISDWLGYMLDQADRFGFARIHLVGHPGKLAKVLNDDWQTHSRHAPPANEAVLDCWRRHGVPGPVLKLLAELPLVEGMQVRLLEGGYGKALRALASAIRDRCAARLGRGQGDLTVTLCDMDGAITATTLP